MTQERLAISGEFERVASAAGRYLEECYSPAIGRLICQIIQTLGRLVAPADELLDPFDRRRDEERRLRRLLAELGALEHQLTCSEVGVSGTAAGDAEWATGKQRLLFVYGTLKRGYRRHAALQGQTFLGQVWTAAHYRLYDCGGYPGLVEEASGISIQGELYQVDQQCLIILDEIEGVDAGLYRRGQVQLLPPYDTCLAEAYFYCRSVDGLRDCGNRW